MSALAPRRFVPLLEAYAQRASGVVQPRHTWNRAPRIVNADGGDDGRAKVYIYGLIGSDWFAEDVTAYSFVKELDQITAPAIDLHVNSPGGYVFDGVAIYSALVTHPSTVDVHIDGLAASAASFIAMAGDSVTISKPARMMIHNARGIAIGDATEMRSYAQLLDDVSDTIAEMYADRAGGDVAGWREAMTAETWYSAAEAVEAGLADAVANDPSASSDLEVAESSAGADESTDAGTSDLADSTVRARARVALRG